MAGTAFNEVHDVVPRRRWISRFIRTVAKRVLRAVGVDPGRFRGAARRIAAGAASRRPGRHGQGDTAASDEPTLFFFHFRALNTGWKFPRRAEPVQQQPEAIRIGLTVTPHQGPLVPVHPDGHAHDTRIGAMSVVRDKRIGAMSVIVDRSRDTFTS